MLRKLRISSSELIIPCAIDSDVKACLRPMNLIQSFFFNSKYTIRDNFITCRSYLSIFLSILSVIVITIVHALRISLSDFKNNLFLYINTLIDAVFYIFGFLLNFYVCVSYEGLNIILVLKIQELYKTQIFTRNTIRELTRLNWIYICICSFFYVYYVASLLYILKDCPFETLLILICQFILFAFDINTIYATQIIKILRAALRQWILDINSLTKNKKHTTFKEIGLLKTFCCSRSFPLRSTRVFSSCTCVLSSFFSNRRNRQSISLCQWQDAAIRKPIKAVQTHRHPVEDITDLTADEERKNTFWKDKLTAYATILDAYEISKTAFQLLILYHCAETFIHSVLYVYYITDFLQSNSNKDGDFRLSYSAALAVTYTLKNIVIVTKLNIEYEQFYITVNDAMVNSLMQLTKNCSEQEKRMHRNVVRLSQLSHKFAVCNLFGMDAAMPRRLLSLIATYTIVVLQFMIL